MWLLLSSGSDYLGSYQQYWGSIHRAIFYTWFGACFYLDCCLCLEPFVNLLICLGVLLSFSSKITDLISGRSVSRFFFWLIVLTKIFQKILSLNFWVWQFRHKMLTPLPINRNIYKYILVVAIILTNDDMWANGFPYIFLIFHHLSGYFLDFFL